MDIDKTDKLMEEAREAQAKRTRKRWDAFGILMCMLVPVISFLGIGAEWESMKSGLAGTSIVAAIIASIGTPILMGVCLEWFDGDKK